MPVLRSGQTTTNSDTITILALDGTPPKPPRLFSRTISSYVDGIATVIVVTAASMVYAGIAATVGSRRNVTVTPAAMAYAGAAIVVNAKQLVAVSAALMAYAAQETTARLSLRIVVTAASMMFIGRDAVVSIGGATGRAIARLRFGFRIGF